MARRWGLTTLGEMAALNAGDLSARMGQEGIRLQQLALGRDAGPLVPDPDVPRFIGRMELEWPIDTLEPLSFVLARLLDPLSATLEQADRGAAALRLDLRLVDRTVHARVLQLPVAMREARVLRTLLMLDLESHPPRSRRRHRHHRDRSGARPRDPVFAARAGGALGGNRGDADGAARRAGRRHPLRFARSCWTRIVRMASRCGASSWRSGRWLTPA